MCLKTPPFWYKPAGLKAHLLSPLSLFYAAGHALHQSIASPYKSSIPVICAGNLTAGGSGKTPAALAVLQLVRDRKLADKPCFLTRGYGGKVKDTLLVNRDTHTVQDTGDEPLLLARKAPTIIAPDRAKGARFAERNGYDLIIMDDGMQNPGLEKNVRLVVIDGATGFGNGKLLPAGPLRTPLKKGMAQADAFVLIGDDQHNVKTLLPKDKPAFTTQLAVPESWIANRKIPYVAFCGLAHPDKFKRTLEQTGINIAFWHAYPDHYSFTDKDLQDLAAQAKEAGGRLITTEKDAARIPADIARGLPLDILPVQIVWDDAEAVSAFLEQKTKTA